MIMMRCLRLWFFCLKRDLRKARKFEKMGIGLKYASVLLGRCKKRGWVDRSAKKMGKRGGYIYSLSEKGVGWITRKISKEDGQLASLKAIYYRSLDSKEDEE